MWLERAVSTEPCFYSDDFGFFLLSMYHWFILGINFSECLKEFLVYISFLNGTGEEFANCLKQMTLS
jgi:hypothetical protein